MAEESAKAAVNAVQGRRAREGVGPEWESRVPVSKEREDTTLEGARVEVVADRVV